MIDDKYLETGAQLIRAANVLDAVSHELAVGEAGEGDVREVLWCVRALNIFQAGA
jgi:hypothetical protein